MLQQLKLCCWLVSKGQTQRHTGTPDLTVFPRTRNSIQLITRPFSGIGSAGSLIFQNIIDWDSSMNPAGSRFLLAWTWRSRPVFPWEWSVPLQTSSWWLRLIGEMPTLLELSHWNWLNSCWWWIKPYFYPFARGQLHRGTSELSYFQMFHDKMCSEPPGYFVSWKIDLFSCTNMHRVIKKRMGQKLQLPGDNSTYTLPEAGWQPAIWIRWHWRCP